MKSKIEKCNTQSADFSHMHRHKASEEQMHGHRHSGQFKDIYQFEHFRACFETMENILC